MSVADWSGSLLEWERELDSWKADTPLTAQLAQRQDHLGEGDDGDVGVGLADMRDLACELRFQRGLAALRRAGKVEGLEPFTFPVMEGDRAAGGLAPAGFVAPVLAGAQRHHDAVKRDRGADRLGWDVFRAADTVQRLRPQALPASCRLQARRCKVLADGLMAPISEKNASASRAVP